MHTHAVCLLVLPSAPCPSALPSHHPFCPHEGLPPAHTASSTPCYTGRVCIQHTSNLSGEGNCWALFRLGKGEIPAPSVNLISCPPPSPKQFPFFPWSGLERHSTLLQGVIQQLLQPKALLQLFETRRAMRNSKWETVLPGAHQTHSNPAVRNAAEDVPAL